MKREKCKKLANLNNDSLPRYIKLIDLMQVESLVKVVLSSMETIIADMQQQTARKYGITTEVVYGEEKMDFKQGEDEFQNKFNEIAQDIKDTALGVK